MKTNYYMKFLKAFWCLGPFSPVAGNFPRHDSWCTNPLYTAPPTLILLLPLPLLLRIRIINPLPLSSQHPLLFLPPPLLLLHYLSPPPRVPVSSLSLVLLAVQPMSLSLFAVFRAPLFNILLLPFWAVLCYLQLSGWKLALGIHPALHIAPFPSPRKHDHSHTHTRDTSNLNQ